MDAIKSWQTIARAKVNLSLRVLGRRADGYHALESVVAFADVGDALTLRTAPAWALNVTGPFAATLDGANLVDQAAAAVTQDLGQPLRFAATLDKRLPIAAGIGGGSSDAAAVLRLLKQALGAQARLIDWTRIAASLGADVPVCFADRAAIMGGIGDQLVPLLVPVALPAVLLTPRIDVPARKTAAVFQALAAGPVGAADAARLPLPPMDLAAHLETSRNDLEAPACQVMPPIAAALEDLRSCPGARHVRLSGAGPTAFALFEAAAAADAAAQHLRTQRPEDWIVATTLR